MTRKEHDAKGVELFKGLAFPREGVPQYGMTLRDWFAGQALAGRMINGFASSAHATVHAKVAYAVADAMLAERDKVK